MLRAVKAKAFRASWIYRLNALCNEFVEVHQGKPMVFNFI